MNIARKAPFIPSSRDIQLSKRQALAEIATRHGDRIASQHRIRSSTHCTSSYTSSSRRLILFYIITNATIPRVVQLTSSIFHLRASTKQTTNSLLSHSPRSDLSIEYVGAYVDSHSIRHTISQVGATLSIRYPKTQPDSLLLGAMDEFAQTRGVDDLFDDDIVPVTATAEEVVEETATFEFDPERAWETHPHPQLESQSQSPQTESQAQSQSQSQQKSRGKGLSASVYADAPDDGSTVVVGEYRKRGGGRGRGRGRGRRGRGGRNSGGDNIVRVEGDEQEGVQKGTETENGEQQQEEAEQAKSPDAADQGTDAAAGAVEADDTSNNKSNEEKQEKVYAVRGDRSGTGGVRKVRITEHFLNP